MPQERGYQSQVGPSAAPVAPLASPETYGAQVGAAITQVAQTVHQAQLREYEIQRKNTADRERSQAAARLATWMTDVHGKVTQLRAAPAAGGAGHVEAVKTLLDSERSKLADGVTENSVASWINDEATGFVARTLQSEGDFEAIAGAKKTATDAGLFRDQLLKSIMTSKDFGARFDEALASSDSYIDGLQNLGADGKAAMKREFAGQFTMAVVSHNYDNPDFLEKMLQDPRLLGLLSPDQLADAQQGLALGRQRQEAAARQAEAEAAAAAREKQASVRSTYDAYKLAVENHEPITTAQVNGLLKEAKAAGLPPDELIEIGFLGEASVQYAGWARQPTGSLEQEFRSLDQLRQAGQLSPEGRRRMDRLEKEIDGRDGEAGQSIGDLAKSGPGGWSAAADQLSGMGDEEAYRAAAKAGNTQLFVLRRMEPRQRALIEQGHALRQQRPDDWLPGSKGEANREWRARQVFDTILGPPIKSGLGSAYGDIFNSAMDLYAAEMNKSGRAEWNQTEFESAVQIVMGQRRSFITAGMGQGKLTGGVQPVRGRKTEIPRYWTKEQFEAGYSRSPFKGAFYTNGQPAAPRDVLDNYQLSVNAEDKDGNVLYELHDARGRPLLNRDGSIYLFPVKASPDW